MTALLAIAALVFTTLWVVGAFSRSTGVSKAAGLVPALAKTDYSALSTPYSSTLAESAIAACAADFSRAPWPPGTSPPPRSYWPDPGK